MPHVVEFEGHGSLTVEDGENLLDACDRVGVPMDSACGGFAACNACRVVVLSGEESLSERLEEELPFLDQENHRLGCQITLCGSAKFRLDSGM